MFIITPLCLQLCATLRVACPVALSLSLGTYNKSVSGSLVALRSPTLAFGERQIHSSRYLKFLLQQTTQRDIMRDHYAVEFCSEKKLELGLLVRFQVRASEERKETTSQSVIFINKYCLPESEKDYNINFCQSLWGAVTPQFYRET